MLDDFSLAVVEVTVIVRVNVEHPDMGTVVVCVLKMVEERVVLLEECTTVLGVLAMVAVLIVLIVLAVLAVLSVLRVLGGLGGLGVLGVLAVESGTEKHAPD